MSHDIRSNGPLPPSSPQRSQGWGEGPLAEALHGATEADRALLLLALLQQAQSTHIEVHSASDGMSAVQIRLNLTSTAVAEVLRADPSPQAMAALIGLASI